MHPTGNPGFRGPSASLNVVHYGYDYNAQTQTLETSNATYDNTKHPFTGSFFIQNRVEYDDLIISIGMRFDYLNTRDYVLKDPLYPLGGGFTLDADEVEKSHSRLTLSPRLDLFHSFSKQAAFHAHYGVFRQLPAFQYLHTGLSYLTHHTSQARTFYAFGNPNLALPRTSAFEMGLTHIGSVTSPLMAQSTLNALST